MKKNTKWIIGIAVAIILVIIAIPVVAMLLIVGGGYAQGTPSCLFEDAGFVCNEVTPIMDTNSGFLYINYR